MKSENPLPLSDHKLLTEKIKAAACDIGFNAIGIAKPEVLTSREDHFRSWLEEGNHGRMSYLQKNFSCLMNPFELMEELESIVVVIMSYYPALQQPESSVYKIAKYGYGKDYHKVVTPKVKQLAAFINSLNSSASTRVFVDSGKVPEKIWATKAGLGWQGKHSLVIHPAIGSFFFIGVIFTNIQLEYDTPLTDHCGKCTKCMDACPADAIIKPYTIDARKCFSYQTIESRDRDDIEFSPGNKEWIFGCDACQDVCPYNKAPALSSKDLFGINPIIISNNSQNWENLTEKEFSEHLYDSAIIRVKYKGLKRNIEAVRKNRLLNS